MFFEIKTNLALRSEIRMLKNKIEILKNTNRQIIEQDGETLIKSENDYTEMLHVEIEKNNKQWENKFKKLSAKIESNIDDTAQKSRQLEFAFEDIENQRQKIFELKTKIKPYVEKMKFIKSEEINASGAIIKEIQNFLNQYDKNLLPIGKIFNE